MYCKLFYTLILFCAFFNSFSQTVTWGNGNSRTDTRNNAGLDGNQGAMSGFYEAWQPDATFPAGANGWYHLLDVRHSNGNNNYAMQFSGSFFDQNLFFRKTTNNPTAAWNRVLLEDPNGTTSTGRLLTRSIAYVDNDKFNYNNGINTYSVNSYGLEWNFDSWRAGAPTAWLSGIAGIKLFTSSQCRLAITWDGKVGIGTTNPQEPLSVNGTIASKRIRVTQSGWPDYVFDQKYSLRNLKAVELYINKHKHLPDVPAAAQVEKNGLDLGENQAVLLRKVEELTLYVIKLNKAVNQLQAENKLNKRTIAALTRKR